MRTVLLFLVQGLAVEASVPITVHILRVTMAASKAMKVDVKFAGVFAQRLQHALPASAGAIWKGGEDGNRSLMCYMCTNIDKNPTDWLNLQEHINILDQETIFFSDPSLASPRRRTGSGLGNVR